MKTRIPPQIGLATQKLSTVPGTYVTIVCSVMPAKTGIQKQGPDTGLRRCDDRNSRTCLSGLVVSPLLLLLMILPLSICSCDYGRMKDDEAIHTYESSMPTMPQNTVPTTGGIEAIKEAAPQNLKNPLARNPEVLERGKERYGFYCIQCHGPKADGDGTVGQSFAPLPTQLLRRYVQKQSDGELYVKISLGFRRHPPLAATVAEEDRWAIIHYLRTQAGAQRVSSLHAE
jgi:mono/diheme cytochrome c family protein